MSFLELDIVAENVIIPGVSINLGVPQSPSLGVTGAARHWSQSEDIQEIKLIQRLLHIFIFLPLTLTAGTCLATFRSLALTFLSVLVCRVDPVETDGLNKTEIVQLLSVLVFVATPLILAVAHSL